MESTTVVSRDCLAFPKVVALHLIIVPTQPLPVDLVQTVRHQHSRADYALSWGRLDLELDPTKHDVPFRVDVRVVS